MKNIFYLPYQMFNITFMALLLLGALTAAQKLSIDKFEVISLDQNYIDGLKYNIFKYNDTHQAFNASGTLKKDIGMKLKDNIEVYSIEDNEKRLITSANDIDVCDLLNGDYKELEAFFKFGNFTKCPMKQAYYEVKNAVMDTNNLPPMIPKGTFVIDVRSYDDSIEFLHSQTTLTVS